MLGMGTASRVGFYKKGEGMIETLPEVCTKS